MDKQPGQRQRDGQQQPRPQPGRQKTHMFSVPCSSRLAASPAARRLIGRLRHRLELYISDVAGSQAGRTAGHVRFVFAALPAARHTNHNAGEGGSSRAVGMIMTSCSSSLPGSMVAGRGCGGTAHLMRRRR
jgi:hypothetical protein